MIPIRQLAPAMAAIVLASACSDRDPEPAPTNAGSGAQPKVAAAPARDEAETLDCTYPVRGGESAEAVVQRFGADARRETLIGAEGIEYPAVVLWGDDRSRRVEVQLGEAIPARVAGATVGEGSRRRMAGIGVGDALAEVTRVNGRAFRLFGFSWDYGGYVSDWQAGNLSKHAGNCDLTVRFSPSPDAPIADAIMGDQAVASDHPAMPAARPVVSEIGIGFGSVE